MIRRFALLAAAALALGACAAGPDYRAPQAKVGSAPFVAAQPDLFSPAEPPADWWRLYRDPTLDGLVAQAFQNNKDLAVAEANLAQVRGLLSEARAGQLPSTVVSGAAQRARQLSPLNGQPYTASIASAGLDVAYEVDLFGRVRRSVEAAAADTGAAQAALDVVRVSVAGETARAYADACSANLEITVAQRSLRLLQDTADLTARQLDAGRGTGLDVARAQAEAESARATIPTLQADHDAALFRLAVLTGRPPAGIPPAIGTCAKLPELTALIPVGDGASLLRRRPDVRQAERRLAAATARIGVATASLYPQVTLGGSVSTIGGAGQHFGGDVLYSVGPLIQWSFPNMAVARARIAQADAATWGALASFDQATLVALQETETALDAYAKGLDRRAALRRARDQGARAVELSRMRQTSGVDSFLTVLDAERTLTNLEAQLAQAEADVAGQQITVFKALGGGWTGGS